MIHRQKLADIEIYSRMNEYMDFLLVYKSVALGVGVDIDINFLFVTHLRNSSTIKFLYLLSSHGGTYALHSPQKPLYLAQYFF